MRGVRRRKLVAIRESALLRHLEQRRLLQRKEDSSVVLGRHQLSEAKGIVVPSARGRTPSQRSRRSHARSPIRRASPATPRLKIESFASSARRRMSSVRASSCLEHCGEVDRLALEGIEVRRQEPFRAAKKLRKSVSPTRSRSGPQGSSGQTSAPCPRQLNTYKAKFLGADGGG